MYSTNVQGQGVKGQDHGVTTYELQKGYKPGMDKLTEFQRVQTWWKLSQGAQQHMFTVIMSNTEIAITPPRIARCR